MKRGDCVYHAAKSYAVAHAVESVIGGRVRTACGRWYEMGELNHNLSRREPCGSCASAIERRNVSESACSRSCDTQIVNPTHDSERYPETVRTQVSNVA